MLEYEERLSPESYDLVSSIQWIRIDVRILIHMQAYKDVREHTQAHAHTHIFTRKDTHTRLRTVTP